MKRCCEVYVELCSLIVICFFSSSKNHLHRQPFLWHIPILLAHVLAVPKRMKYEYFRQSFTKPYLSSFQIFVVFLWWVTHSFNCFIMNFETKFDTLMECIHWFTCCININDLPWLYVTLFMIYTRFYNTIANSLEHKNNYVVLDGIMSADWLLQRCIQHLRVNQVEAFGRHQKMIFSHRIN